MGILERLREIIARLVESAFIIIHPVIIIKTIEKLSAKHRRLKMPKSKAKVSARRMITARRCKAMVTERGCIRCISMPTFARYGVALLEYYCR